MKILMTGPDNDASRSLGGIVTVVNMIVQNSFQHHITYFDRDMGDTNKVSTFCKKISLFRSRLQKEKFDLIHFHFSFDYRSVLREALYVMIAKRKNKPIIVHFHGGILLFRKKDTGLVKWILNAADRIIVLSDIEKDSVTNLYKVAHAKVIVLRNCIDLKEIPDFKINTYNENQRLIFFGRLHESKGIVDIAEACKILNKQSSDFRFDAYGSGPGQEWFITMMQNILGDRFSYKGVVWGEKKWHALQDSDLFILPSRFGEGLPMAMLEAMSLGKVVIVSDDASITKVVTDNVNGLLVPKNNPLALADKIRSIAGNSADRKRIGENAKATIAKEYSSDYYMDTLNSIYSTLN